MHISLLGLQADCRLTAHNTNATSCCGGPSSLPPTDKPYTATRERSRLYLWCVGRGVVQSLIIFP